MKQKQMVIILLLSLLLPGVVTAQGGDPVREPVTLEAADGLLLVGDYYAPQGAVEGPLANDDGLVPAVLLAHQSNGSKARWHDQIPAFVEAGYGVLVIDLRGHGETGGRIESGEQVSADIQDWVGWLREQSDIDPLRINIVGASLGGDMSVPLLAADPGIVSLVVISPLLDIQGVNTADALAAAGDRPVFFVATSGDDGAMAAVHTYMDIEGVNVMVRVYDNSACCTGLFLLERDLLPSILNWLSLYN